MRALVYSDLQATDGHEKLFGDPTQSLQIARVCWFYARLLQIYHEHKCDCLWDLGDTTDDRSAVPVPAISEVCASLAKFPVSEWNLKLIGNHEQFLRNTKVHVGNMFAPYFTVVEGNASYKTQDGTTILCCSYPAEQANTAKWLLKRKELGRSNVILLGHFSVVGCMTGDGRLMTGIPKEAVSWANLGLLGHIHKPQTISKKVHYVGSPFQQNWGEKGEDKRVGIVDTSTCSVQWVPIEGFPIYQTVDLSGFQELCSQDTEDRFKVVLRSQDESAAFYALPTAHRAEPIYDFIDDGDGSEVSCDGAPVGQKWTFDSVIKRYVERNTPESKGIPASVDEMVDYGKTIATVS